MVNFLNVGFPGLMSFPLPSLTDGAIATTSFVAMVLTLTASRRHDSVEGRWLLVTGAVARRPAELGDLEAGLELRRDPLDGPADGDASEKGGQQASVPDALVHHDGEPQPLPRGRDPATAAPSPAPPTPPASPSWTAPASRSARRPGSW